MLRVAEVVTIFKGVKKEGCVGGSRKVSDEGKYEFCVSLNAIAVRI